MARDLAAEFRELFKAGLTQGEILNLLSELGDASHYAGAIATAREETTDDLEIDDKPLVSPGADNGVWVSAWVWVPLEAAARQTVAEFVESHLP